MRQPKKQRPKANIFLLEILEGGKFRRKPKLSLPSLSNHLGVFLGSSILSVGGKTQRSTNRRAETVFLIPLFSSSSKDFLLSRSKSHTFLLGLVFVLISTLNIRVPMLVAEHNLSQASYALATSPELVKCPDGYAYLDEDLEAYVPCHEYDEARKLFESGQDATHLTLIRGAE